MALWNGSDSDDPEDLDQPLSFGVPEADDVEAALSPRGVDGFFSFELLSFSVGREGNQTLAYERTGMFRRA